MQAAFFVSSRGINEKQVGILFLAFGLAQFVCTAPAGYLLDYSDKKIQWVMSAAVVCSILTVASAASALPNSDNLTTMIVLKILQGAVTSVIPPAFNGITLGIVGSPGFTHQVSRNRMMNHVGTASVVAIGSLVAYFLYPTIGALFLVSPLAALGVVYNLRRIIPTHVDRDAARSLILESRTMTEYELAEEVALSKQRAKCLQKLSTQPSREPSSALCMSGNSRSLLRIQDNPTSLLADMAASTLLPASLDERIAEDSALAGNQFGAGVLEKDYHPPRFLNDLEPPSTKADMYPLRPFTSDAEHERSNAPLPPPTSSPIPHNRDYHASSSSASSCRRDQRSSTSASRSSCSSLPSFAFGWKSNHTKQPSSDQPTISKGTGSLRARTPLSVLVNPTLLVFCCIIFFFNVANASVLPLVMQSLALQDAQASILLSGLCIVIAQVFMSSFAMLCGVYTPYWGRKSIMLVGLASLTVRCFLLTFLVPAETRTTTPRASLVLKALILSTQFLDSVGAGILGTAQIFVTSDLSGGTGRFSLIMGVTTGAMCLGATVSSYVGQVIAYEYGYSVAFTSLGMVSLLPFVLYVFLMPETLPEYARPPPRNKRRRRLRELLRRLNVHRRNVLQSKSNPFRQRELIESQANEALHRVTAPESLGIL